jgi:lipoate-protein ligase B
LNPEFADKRWICVDLPVVEYDTALDLQERLVAAKNNGIMKKEIVILLEHPPVFTLGRSGGIENLTVSPAFLEKLNIPIVQAERGGNITFHGPGQLVVYPIIDLDSAGLEIPALVDTLEEIMRRVAADCGIQAERNALNRGIWVGNKKLGSIGISVRRGVSFHGFSLNVNLSLEPFNWINPCGLQGVGVTSMERESAQKVSMDPVRKAVKFHLGACFGVDFLPTNLVELKELL